MKSTLFIAILILGHFSEAKEVSPAKTPKRKLAQVSTRGPMADRLMQYFACTPDVNSSAAVQKLNLCVKEIVSPQASPSRLDRFKSWLLLPTEILAVRNCTKEEAQRTSGFPEATPNAICFDFKLDNVKHTAVAFFENRGEYFYLHSFDY